MNNSETILLFVVRCLRTIHHRSNTSGLATTEEAGDRGNYIPVCQCTTSPPPVPPRGFVVVQRLALFSMRGRERAVTVTTLIGYVLPFSTNEQQLWKLAGRCKQCRGRYLLGGAVRSVGGERRRSTERRLAGDCK